MRRRSLIITVFCLGEIVFAVQLIIQAELVKSEVKEWNEGQKALPDVKTRCARLAGGKCCNNDKILDALRKPYENFKKAKRNGKYLEPILYPLAAVVGANALAAIMFNSGTFDLTKFMKNCCPEACIKGMSFMLWCICWLAEIGIGGFVLSMIILAKTDFIPGNLQSLDLCKNSGQTVRLEGNSARFSDPPVPTPADCRYVIAALWSSRELVLT
ncbi:unnamed protein product [Allacma fusca]|uniref:Uncharacterized protein n=1 Tax=Allacma fusca TaxID=39272 RepID=A0A8J2KX12_9HEXA|nr:unnamed protein product [Allacma fusca]